MGNQITEVTFRYFLIIIELGKLKSLCNVKRNNLHIFPASELDYGIPPVKLVRNSKYTPINFRG